MRAATGRWLMPRRGGAGDGSGQAVWTCRPQARLDAWPRPARPHGAAPEPPSRRALLWHQPSSYPPGIVRLLLVSLLAVALVAVSAALAAGGPAPAPRPKTGAVPWRAPKDPMRRTRLAGLVPEVNEHLAYHVHSHLDVFVNGSHVKIPAGIG